MPPGSAPKVARGYLTLSKSRRKLLCDTMAKKGYVGLIPILNPTANATNSEKRLLDLNSVIDDHGNTLLHLAVCQSDQALTGVLLLKGANPNIPNYSGTTPFRLAYLMNLSEIVEMLVRHGAVDASMNINDYQDWKRLSSEIASLVPQLTPEEEAEAEEIRARFKSTTDNTILKRFTGPKYAGESGLGNSAYIGLSSFSDVLNELPPDSPDGMNVTPLMKACFKNHVKIVDLLLQKNANVMSLDAHGYNTLVWACLGGSLESFKLVFPNVPEDRRNKILNSAFGIHPAPMLSLLTAAIHSQNSLLVKHLLDLGCEPSLKAGLLDPMQLAVILGSPTVIEVLTKKRGPLFQGTAIDNIPWLLEGLAVKEGLLKSDILPDGYKMPNASSFTPMQRGIDGQNASTAALSVFQLIGIRDEDVSKKAHGVDPKIAESVKQMLGARVASRGVMANSSKIRTAEEVLTILNFHNVSDQIAELANYFHSRGTYLDLVHMAMVRNVLQLMAAIKRNTKEDYVVIAGKAIQEAGEIVRAVENWFDKKDVASYDLFSKSLIYRSMSDLNKSLKEEEVKQMLLNTRLAVGAWPPPEAVPNMVKSAIKMCRVAKKLVLLAGCTGHWPPGEIDIEQFAEGSQKQYAKADGKLSYEQYQRQAESTLLNQIQQQKVTDAPNVASPIANSASSPSTASTPDDRFFDSIDNWVRQFVQYVQKLKVAKSEQRKDEYVSNASAIYARCDALIEEIRPYYLFKDLESDFIVDRTTNATPFRVLIRESTAKILEAAEKIIFHSNLASGVWPPPNSAEDMMNAVMPVVALVKALVNYVKAACKIIRKTENAERQKMESFMNEWVQSAKVRDLFNQWEKITLSSLQKEGDAETPAAAKGELTPEEKALLDDGRDGLLFETKGSVEIIKAGRLMKLVERLADHAVPDITYRNAFLLTHHSFTNSADLLDLLTKRYDAAPPYGLDQRSFELFVNRKIVPIRLRVFNVLKFWMAKYREDFTKNKMLSDKCLHFIQSKMRVDFGSIASEIAEMLKTTQAEKVYEPDDPAKFPKSVIPKGISVEDLKNNLSSNSRYFLEIDAVELARQITLNDWKIFRAIRAKEFLDQGWEKADKLQRSPNITAMIKNTNNLTFWVVTSIVTCEDIKIRVALMKYFVGVAQACMELNNFNAVTAFIAGLMQGPVHRMTKTWKMFKEKLPKVYDLFNEISDSVSAKGQYSKYRSILKAASPPIMPFLGVYLTDLTFVALGNPDYLPENNYINFDKRIKVTSIIDDVLKHQDHHHLYAPSQPVQDFISNLGANGWMEEREFYEKSLLSEPREEESDED